MSDLVLPGSTVPAILSLPPGARVKEVDGDLYNICERIQREVEGGERLRIVLHEDHPQPWVVMELGDDNLEHFVLRTDSLDARVIDKLQHMRRVPLQDRLKAFEVVEAKNKERAHEEELDELYERVGGPMWPQLERDGFVETRGVSYPKRGVKPK